MVPIITRIRAHDLAEFGEPIRHHGEEFIFVIERSIEVHLEFYTSVTLAKGQGIYLDSTMGHAYVAKNCESALVLAEIWRAITVHLHIDRCTVQKALRPGIMSVTWSMETPMEQLRTRAENRRFCASLVFVALVAFELACGGASAQSTPGTASAIQADSDEARIADLVEANHILANEHVLDGFGHISVRSIRNPKHFYMSRSRAPALVTAGDIIELDENSEPVAQHGAAMYGERYIHGEIFRVRPDVQAVVHSHSPQVVPFSVTNAPFQAIAHMAAFLGASPVPVFEIRDVLGPNNDLLVRNNRTGAALAKVLGDRTVVLMRGHGMAVVAPSVRMVVLRAIYTQLNAQIESEALKLGAPTFLNTEEASRTDPTDRPWEIWAANADRAVRATSR